MLCHFRISSASDGFSRLVVYFLRTREISNPILIVGVFGRSQNRDGYTTVSFDYLERIIARVYEPWLLVSHWLSTM